VFQKKKKKRRRRKERKKSARAPDAMRRKEEAEEEEKRNAQGYQTPRIRKRDSGVPNTDNRSSYKMCACLALST
jgi:hypothetical protein